MTAIDLSKLFSLHCVSIDAALRSAVLEECEVLSDEECPNLWIPAEYVPSTPKIATQLLVNQIHKHVLSSRLGPGFAGVELWVQKYEGGKGLAFHFDKDEHALQKTGDMVHPQFSSVVYLTGERTQPRQAPTVVYAQRYDNDSETTVPENPCSSVIVFPRMDQVLVFDGSLAHGVVPGPPIGTRMTLLINWWEQRPQDVPQLSTKVLKGLGMILRESSELQSLEGAASNSTASEVGHSKVILSDFLQDGGAELVSAICDDAGVKLHADSGADAVLFEHAGWELVECEVESWAEETCGAAWVAVGLADDSPEEGTDDS